MKKGMQWRFVKIIHYLLIIIILSRVKLHKFMIPARHLNHHFNFPETGALFTSHIDPFNFPRVPQVLNIRVWYAVEVHWNGAPWQIRRNLSFMPDASKSLMNWTARLCLPARIVSTIHVFRCRRRKCLIHFYIYFLASAQHFKSKFSQFQ